MRILLINQFFWPDSAATSQLLTDLARSLRADGHEVTAVCSGRGGYTAAAETSDHVEGVTIRRVKGFAFSRGRIGRILSYVSFYMAAAVQVFFIPRPDVVVTLTTPPVISVLGSMLKFVRGCRFYIWEMDVYPDVATDLNYFRAGGVIDRIVGLVADTSRKHADGIIALGECMKARLVRRSIPASRIFVSDNWADGKAITPQARPGNPEQLVLLYSGNLGLAHDLNTLKGAVQGLKADRRFRFIFSGSGALMNDLKGFQEEHGIESIEFRSFVRRESLSQNLALGDIGLVTQNLRCCGSVVPSKVYGLLAAGRPILFIGPEHATPARIVHKFNCGWHVAVGDVRGLMDLLERLANNRAEVELAGIRARKALDEYFDMPHGLARLTTFLTGRAATGSIPRLAAPTLSATPMREAN
jgi:colanic acid biosynthesis glycosyl transferase WcaI